MNLPSTEHHLGRADPSPGRGRVTNCGFSAGVEVPVGFGQVRTWTYVTGIDVPAQCSTELRAVYWLVDTDRLSAAIAMMR